MDVQAILKTAREVLTDGIDYSLPGNGGPECRDHVAMEHRLAETAFALSLFVVSVAVGLRFDSRTAKEKAEARERMKREASQPPPRPPLHSVVYLLVFTIVMGVELGYKFATKEVIWLVNPCHMLSFANILVLAAFVSGRSSSNVVQFSVTFLSFYFHAPIAALIFPVTNTLFLPFEPETYFVQHYLVAFAPIYNAYLIRRQVGWGSDRGYISNLFLSFSFWIVYHFVFLQGGAVLTVTNLGSMLCSAISDPFGPMYYRMHAIWHQFLCVATSGLIYHGLSMIASARRDSKRKSA